MRKFVTTESAFSNWCRSLCGRAIIPYDEGEENEDEEEFYLKKCDPYILEYYYM